MNIRKQATANARTTTNDLELAELARRRDALRAAYARAVEVRDWRAEQGHEPAYLAALDELARIGRDLATLDAAIQAGEREHELGLGYPDRLHFEDNAARVAELAREHGANFALLSAELRRFHAELRACDDAGYRTSYLREHVRDLRAALWAVRHAPDALKLERELAEDLLEWDELPDPGQAVGPSEQWGRGPGGLKVA